MNEEFEDLIRQGDEAYDNNEIYKAIEFFERAYAIDSSNQDLILSMTAAYHAVGEYQRVIDLAQKGLTLFPHEKRYAFNAALAFNSSERNNDAIDWYTRAIEIDSDYALAYYARGNCYFFDDNYSKALPDYRKAVELKLEKDDLQELIGNCLEKTGSFEEAITCYKAAGENSDSPEIERRIEICNACLDGIIDPDEGGIQTELYAKLIQKGDKAYEDNVADKAIDYYTTAYGVNPADRELILSLSAAYHAAGNYNKAIEIAEYGLELYPDEKRYAFNAGLTSNSLDENYDAIAWYTKAIELDENYALAYFARGNCYFFWDDYDTPLGDYLKAWELGLDQIELPEKLARCLEHSGSYDEAVKMYLIAEEKNPGAENRLRLAISTYIAEGPLSSDAMNRLTESWKELGGRIELEVYITALMRFRAMDEQLPEQEKRLASFPSDWEAGDDSILKCPSIGCHQMMVKKHPETEGDYCLERWTDGFWDANGAHIPPNIVKCPNCGKWYMVKDCPVLFVIPFHKDEDYGMMPLVDYIDQYTTGEYLEAVLQPDLASHELELRMRLWWKQNEKRRNPEDEKDDDLTAELYENLERIAELALKQDSFDNGKELIKGRAIAAEAYRQMGDFESALDLIGDDDTETGKTIGLYCRAQKIDPVHTGERPVPDEVVGKYSVEEIIGMGYYPYPAIEDVFAFPLREKIQEDEFLQVKLSLLNEDWQGWATFFCGENSYRHHRDRLFTDEEWETYQKLPEAMKEDLHWFWGFKSFAMPEDKAGIDRYFRIMYMLYTGILEPPKEDELKEYHNYFDPAWQKLIDEAEKNKKIWKKYSPEWLLENRERCYWFFFWYCFAENAEAPDRETLLDLVNIFRDSKEKYQLLREKSIKGVPYIKLGGSPGWWQDSDKTPENSSGKKLNFIGQIWTDYFNTAISRLVYVFYDPEEKLLKQIFDYD